MAKKIYSRKKKPNKNIGKQGKEIMKTAKNIQKEFPKMCWTDCVKKAGKYYKQKHR